MAGLGGESTVVGVGARGAEVLGVTDEADNEDTEENAEAGVSAEADIEVGEVATVCAGTLIDFGSYDDALALLLGGRGRKAMPLRRLSISTRINNRRYLKLPHIRTHA